jgi:hypothetical protein
MPYEKQPDALPTNKSLTAAAIGAGFMLHVEPVIAELWPEIAPAWAAGPAATDAIAWAAGILAALIVAWWVPDRAGVNNA